MRCHSRRVALLSACVRCPPPGHSCSCVPPEGRDARHPKRLPAPDRQARQSPRPLRARAIPQAMSSLRSRFSSPAEARRVKRPCRCPRALQRKNPSGAVPWILPLPPVSATSLQTARFGLPGPARKNSRGAAHDCAVYPMRQFLRFSFPVAGKSAQAIPIRCDAETTASAPLSPAPGQACGGILHPRPPRECRLGNSAGRDPCRRWIWKLTFPCPRRD